MADEPALTGEPIVVPGAPGSISVERVGERPVLYTGRDGDGKPVDDLDSALRSLFADAGVASLPMGANLSDTYGQRADERESAALEAQAADLDREDAFAAEAMATIGAVGKDVAEGVFLEGGQAVLSGAKKAVNSTLDLIEEVADALPASPTVEWSGFDGDASTAPRVDLTFEKSADIKKRTGLKALLPRIGIGEKEEPTTNTGKVIEGISQFTTGMLGGGAVLKGWTAATRGGRIGKAMATGAIADFTAFDGHQERLSNALAEMAPEQAKPLFEFLAADSEDPELVGRAKAAVEGLGLGVAADGFMRGLRAMRAVKSAKAEARRAAQAEGLQIDPVAEVAALKAEADKTQAEVAEALGNSKARGSIVSFGEKIARQKGAAGSTQDAARSVRESTIDPNSFDINFARIETPDDVKAVISTLLERHAGDAEKARRGVRSWENTQKAAGRMDWVAAMANRRTGDAVNAETAVAFREALNTSATKLLSLAQAVKAEPSVANQYAFRRMMAVHRAIQLEFMGARAEAGRSLNAFKIPAGTPERSLRQIDSLLADAGGANASRDMADKLLDAAAKGDQALNTFVAQGAMARSRAMIRLVYTNSLLTSLGTPVRNLMGNTSALMLNQMAHVVAPRMARALGDQADTRAGEAAAMAHGQMAAVRDMFRLNPKDAWARISANGFESLRRDGVFRGAAPGIDDAAPAGIRLAAGREESGMVADALNSRPLAAAAWGVDEDTVLGRTLDVVQMVVESPSNFNAAADDFFKVIAARGALHAAAFRQAMREAENGALEGVDAIKARMAEIVDNPTSDMLDAAEREMHELTFTRDTGKKNGQASIADGFGKVRTAMDSRGPVPIGTIVMPFLRTPANLISMGLRYSPLAPFMQRFADDIAEGGVRAEIAKAQMAIGTAFWSLWLGMAQDGKLTGNGPGNRQQKEALMRQDEFGGAKWQPNSILVGDRWISVQGIDPVSTSILLAANVGEIASNEDWNEERDQDMGEVSAHAIAAMGEAFFDKTMLQSALDTAAALTSGDAAQAELLLKGRASAMVPASGALRAFRRGEDPYLREVSGMAEAMRNTVPGLSESLPMQRDLWGKPRTYQSGLGTVYDAIAPVQTKPAGGSAIDHEILKNGVVVSMPQRTIQVDGETVPLKNRLDIYSEFVRRSGEPAFKHLEAVIAGDHEDSEFYAGLSDGPDGEKAAYIKDVIRAYRADAREQVLELYGADLNAMLAEKVRRRQKARAEAE